MTLKESKFKAELMKPENRLNMAKCMRKAGYTEGSVRAGSKYSQLRKITQELDFLDPNRINQDTAMNREEARKVEDYGVVEAIDKRRAQMAGMITLKQENTIIQEPEHYNNLSKRLLGLSGI